MGKTGPGGATTYRYDDANRLRGATTPEGEVGYVYDADGLRVRQTFTPNGGAGTTTWYVQDTVYPYAQDVEEYTSQGSGAKTLAATFTFADELVSQTRYANRAPTTRFIQKDGFDSTRWLTDGTGAITGKVDYDAFGVEIARSGTTDVEHLYRGEAFDPNVGFYNLRARWLSPALGRFTSVDPIVGWDCDPATLHDYVYAHDDPVNLADPSGASPFLDVTFAQVQSVYSRSSSATRAFKAYNSVRRTLCKQAGIGAKNVHHVFPKFLGGKVDQTAMGGMREIFESHHKQFHKLLHYALKFNGLGGNKSRAHYQAFFSANPRDKAKYYEVLVSVTETFDKACLHHGKEAWAPIIRQMKNLNWLDF